MTVDEAIKMAKELNQTGKNKDEWFYYPALHIDNDNWFVMRRLKTANVKVACFTNGNLSTLEL